MRSYFFALLSLPACVLASPFEIGEKKEIVELLSSITQKQQELSRDIEKLQRLLGVESALYSVEPIEVEGLRGRALEATKKGIKAFSAKNYEEAKEAFHEAWERLPEKAATSFNLGLAYHRMGNNALGRKLLKAALELDPDLAAGKEIKRYLTGDVATLQKVERESEELKKARTELINLRKEVDSYLSSRSMDLPERMAAGTAILRKMEKVAEDYDILIEEYFLDISDRYATFEMYDKALTVLARYEHAMEGKVLPDGYHKTLLDMQDKQKAQGELLAKYLDPSDDGGIVPRLEADLREIGIFANQIEQFVEHPKQGDSDFDKVCHRLKEYRWGDKPHRHVVVADRFQRVLFSSLPGTLPLDQYQDVHGEKFFKNICLLADKEPGAKPRWASVNLSVNGNQTPYVLLYAYVPRHEAFLIVRLPERDIR